MKNPVVVDLGLANLTLNTFLSETVNEISEVYLFVNIPMLLATIAVNIWVIKVVEEKKTGRVTRPKLEQNTNAVNIRRPFDPTAHELDANFRLTRFADLKGRGCKVPQEVLLKLLEGLADDGGQQDEQHFMAHMSIPRIGTFFPYTNC